MPTSPNTAVASHESLWTRPVGAASAANIRGQVRSHHALPDALSVGAASAAKKGDVPCERFVMTEAPVITVDGPGGAGKGTLCVALARHLGWHLLDSGALYRLVALAAWQRGVALDDTLTLAEVARDLDVAFTPSEDSDQPQVRLDGHAVGDALRSDETGQGASEVAALPAVRDALMDRQRAFRAAPGLIADGRDMGTVIFPDAELKIFLTASPEERAQRRYKQLKDKGLDANLRDLFESIAARDARDAERAVAPLEPAEDAIILDSTSVDAEGVLAQVLAAARARGLGKS